jgi:hypothetical protein
MERTAAGQRGTPFPTNPYVKQTQPTITEEDVRLRAFEIYLRRGDNPGDALGDWLQAERELKEAHWQSGHFIGSGSSPQDATPKAGDARRRRRS